MRIIFAILLFSFSASESYSISPGYRAPWPDFADFQHSGGCEPLIGEARDYETISKWRQDKLELLYACLPAGPIPDGYLKGRVILPEGSTAAGLFAYLKGLGINVSTDGLKNFTEALWRGKQFYRDSKALLNKIGPNLNPILSVPIAGQMRFPAKVFCGQSLLDSRRESIVMDYNFSQSVKINGKSPYSDLIDWIVAGRTTTGKKGLGLRDEMRMIRPGFYLGRSYAARIFLLNFVLTGSPSDSEDTCWKGYSYP